MTTGCVSVFTGAVQRYGRVIVSRRNDASVCVQCGSQAVLPHCCECAEPHIPQADELYDAIRRVASQECVVTVLIGGRVEVAVRRPAPTDEPVSREGEHVPLSECPVLSVGTRKHESPEGRTHYLAHVNLVGGPTYTAGGETENRAIRQAVQRAIGGERRRPTHADARSGSELADRLEQVHLHTYEPTMDEEHHEEDKRVIAEAARRLRLSDRHEDEGERDG